MSVEFPHIDDGGHAPPLGIGYVDARHTQAQITRGGASRSPAPPPANQLRTAGRLEQITDGFGVAASRLELVHSRAAAIASRLGIGSFELVSSDRPALTTQLGAFDECVDRLSLLATAFEELIGALEGL